MRTPSDHNTVENLTHRILQVATGVYRHLGPGQEEQTYIRAISQALKRQKIAVERCFPIDVWRNDNLEALYFVDLFIESQIIVEVETRDDPINRADRMAMIDYLRASDSPLGLIINFDGRGFEYNRIVARR
jgi:GxxExxY protein